MVYNYKDRKLYIEGQTIKLSENESRLFMLLSDNEVHSIKEIEEFLYKKICSRNAIGQIILRLRLKIEPDIYVQSKFQYGYYIEDEIYLDDNKLERWEKKNVKK